MKTLDARFRYLGPQGAASPDIVIVEIDETSLGNLERQGVGAWPWPRDVYAVFLRYMRSAGARLVVFDVIFGEARVGEEQEAYDREFVEATGESANVVHAISLGNESETLVEIGGPEDEVLRQAQQEAQRRRQELLERNSIPAQGGFPAFVQATPPFLDLGEKARALGHVAVLFDPDGPWRRYLPMARYGDRLLPSLALTAALQSQGLTLDSLRVGEREIQAGNLRVPLDKEWRLPIWFNGPPGTYTAFPFWKVFVSQLQIEEGEPTLLQAEAFRGKTVLVGVTAAGLHDIFTTPYSGTSQGQGFGKMSGVEAHANVLDNLLQGRYLKRPPGWVNWLIWAGLAAGVLALALYARLAVAGIGGLAAMAAWLALAFGLFGVRWQLPLASASFSWALAFGLGLAYQYWVEGADKRKVKSIFSKYVSRDVFQKLMTDPAAAELGGKRANISVLFSDLRGFTSMSENRTPEEVITQLNEYFSAMVEIVFEHRGTIDKFVGDMIMALFNTPLPDPDHADHAVQCAVQMHRKLVEMNKDWAARGQPQLHCGVGVNSGDMVAGNLGSETIRAFTVIGDNVNLGARLESLCKEYKSDIIISEFTLALLKNGYPVQELGDVLVKGKTKPVKIFRVFWEPGAESQPKLERKQA